jgi:superfamily II helicase
MRLDDVMQGYSAGRGIAWMYAKRLEDMQSAGLVKLEGESLILTPKGQRVAKLFARLQEFARVTPSASEVA